MTQLLYEGSLSFFFFGANFHWMHGSFEMIVLVFADFLFT